MTSRPTRQQQEQLARAAAHRRTNSSSGAPPPSLPPPPPATPPAIVAQQQQQRKGRRSLLQDVRQSKETKAQRQDANDEDGIDHASPSTSQLQRLASASKPFPAASLHPGSNDPFMATPSVDDDAMLSMGPELSAIAASLPPDSGSAMAALGERRQKAAMAAAVAANDERLGKADGGKKKKITVLPPMKGWLWKKSPTGFRGAHIWQKRWVVVTAKSLTYWKDPDAKFPKGSIHFANFDTVKKWATKKARFDVTDMHDRVYAWRTKTDEEAAAWATAIRVRLARFRADNERAEHDARELVKNERREAASSRGKLRLSSSAGPASPLQRHDSKRRLKLFQDRINSGAGGVGDGDDDDDDDDDDAADENKVDSGKKKKKKNETPVAAVVDDDDDDDDVEDPNDEFTPLQMLAFAEMIVLHRRQHPSGLKGMGMTFETLQAHYARNSHVLRHLLKHLAGDQDTLDAPTYVPEDILEQTRGAAPVASPKKSKSFRNQGITDVIVEEEDGDDAEAKIDVPKRRVRKKALTRIPPPPPPKAGRSNSALPFDIADLLLQTGNRLKDAEGKSGQKEAKARRDRPVSHQRSQSMGPRQARQFASSKVLSAKKTMCAVDGCTRTAASVDEIRRLRPALGDLKLKLPYCVRHLDDYHEHLRESHDHDEHAARLAAAVSGGALLPADPSRKRSGSITKRRASITTDTKHSWINNFRIRRASMAVKVPQVSLRRLVFLHGFDLIHAVLRVLRGRNQIARGLAVRVLWLSLQYMRALKKEGVGGARDGAGSDHDESEDDDDVIDPSKDVGHLFFVYIRAHASGKRLCASVLAALLDILHRPMESVASRGVAGDDGGLGSGPAGSHAVVQNPVVWAAVFAALRGSDFGIRENGLHDINTLFIHHKDACRSLRSRAGWQLWLYALLEDVPSAVVSEYVPSHRRQASTRRSSYLRRRRRSSVAQSSKLADALSAVGGSAGLNAGLQRKAAYGYTMNLLTLAHFDILSQHHAPAFARCFCGC